MNSELIGIVTKQINFQHTIDILRKYGHSPTSKPNFDLKDQNL